MWNVCKKVEGSVLQYSVNKLIDNMREVASHYNVLDQENDCCGLIDSSTFTFFDINVTYEIVAKALHMPWIYIERVLLGELMDKHVRVSTTSDVRRKWWCPRILHVHVDTE